jgi:hypothetical protein
MATPKIKVTVYQPRWLELIRDKERPVAKAAVEALQEVATEAVAEGRSNIAASGHFTKGWVTGLQYQLIDAEEAGEPSLQAKAEIYHTIGLAGVFEQGITIAGRPLLWIPTNPAYGNIPPRRYPKKLVSATVRGTPMLFEARIPLRGLDPGARKRRWMLEPVGVERRPIYIGVPSISIPKKWRIIEIVKQHASEFGTAFLHHFKAE